MKKKLDLDKYLDGRTTTKKKSLYPPIVDYVMIFVVFLGLPFYAGKSFAFGNYVRMSVSLFFASFCMIVILWGKKIMNALMKRALD